MNIGIDFCIFTFIINSNYHFYTNYKFPLCKFNTIFLIHVKFLITKLFIFTFQIVSADIFHLIGYLYMPLYLWEEYLSRLQVLLQNVFRLPYLPLR